MQGSALKIIQQAASELGLPVPTEGTASRDVTSIQFMSLLNAAGYELSYYHDWEFLTRDDGFDTEENVIGYDLPSDFGRIVNDTIRSTNQTLTALSGPISPQQWRSIVEGGMGAGPNQVYRIKGRKVQIGYTPSEDVNTYSYEYQSNAWVESYNNPDTFTSLIQTDNDIPVFDFFLLVKFLKVKMWQAKGLNTTALEGDMDRLFGSIVSDKGAPTLSLSARMGSELIGSANIPQGSWG